MSTAEFSHPGWFEQQPDCNLCHKTGHVIVEWNPPAMPIPGPCPNGCPGIKASGEIVRNPLVRNASADLRPYFRTFADIQREVDLAEGIIHRDGVKWSDAPLPRRLHRCTAWTTAVRLGVLRCACGAMTRAPFEDRWANRNARRKAGER